MAKVESITKFGFMADGKKYRYQDVSIDRASIVPGAMIELEVKESGKEKIKAPITDVNPPIDVERAKKFTPSFTKKVSSDNTMSKDDWAAKDQRISRQGCIQAAVNALGTVIGPDDLFKASEALANQMLEFVNRKV